MRTDKPGGHQDLDPEWVELIIMALDMGYSKEQIKAFFTKSKQKLTIH